MTFSGVHHRLDSNCHSGSELFTGPTFTVVENLWVFVKSEANSMTAILSNYRESVRFNVFLKRRVPIPAR